MHTNPYISQIISLAIPNKYTKWYCNVIQRASLRASTRQDAKLLLGYTEGHHILPKCFNLGGETDKTNIVYLTAREHFIVHRFLTKMFTVSKFIYQMEKAISKFLCNNTHQNRMLKSSQYELCRKYAAKSQSSKIVSNETKEKQSLIRKGKPTWNKGKTGLKSVPCSPERAKNISESRKLTPKLKCIHCNKETDPGNYKRFHDLNCKLGPNAEQIKIDRKLIAQQSYQTYISKQNG